MAVENIGYKYNIILNINFKSSKNIRLVCNSIVEQEGLHSPLVGCLAIFTNFKVNRCAYMRNLNKHVAYIFQEYDI